MEDNSNTKLAIRLQNDDIEAFNDLYWKYHSAVYANALKLTRDTLVAEDIVQDVFCVLWDKRYSLDPQKDVAGWIFVVCYNKSINQLKQKLKESLAQEKLEKAVENVIDDDNDITDTQLGILAKAMEQLSPQKRKVFELCKIQGKTYEEAARELQISKYTVKEYLSAAVSFIKEYIQQHPEQHAGSICALLLANYLA